MPRNLILASNPIVGVLETALRMKKLKKEKPHNPNIKIGSKGALDDDKIGNRNLGSMSNGVWEKGKEKPSE